MMKKSPQAGLIEKWKNLKASLAVKSNPFEEFPEIQLMELWESLCTVAPIRFALVNVDLPYDIAQLAQLVLATSVPVPHIATYQIGETLDFMRPKISNKIRSWNISEENVKWIPRVKTSLDDLKEKGFRLIGTSPNGGENALEFKWQEKDVVVIGGAKGLSRKNLDKLDTVVKIPCSTDVQFLTIPSVIPILTYTVLQKRGLWK